MRRAPAVAPRHTNVGCTSKYSRSVRPQSSGTQVLGERKDIAVRILEPCHPGATRSQPDAKGVLLCPGISLEDHSSRRKLRNGFTNIGHPPAEYGEWLRRELVDLLHTDPSAVRLEDQGYRFVAQESKPQHIAVERGGTVGIGRRDEGGQGS